MTTRLLALALLLPSLSFAQQVIRLTNVGQRSNSQAVDAGVPDAGVTELRPLSRSTTDLELERLRAEIANLRASVDRQSAQLDQVLSALDKMTTKVGEVKKQLNEQDERAATEKREAQERKVALSSAFSSLAFAQQQLAQGNTNITDALRAAEGVFTGAALKDVQNARAALSQSDLNAARIWLQLAAAEAALSRE